MKVESKDCLTWADLISAITDGLEERDTALNCQVNDLELSVPDKFGSDASHENWNFNGSFNVCFNKGAGQNE